MACLGIFAQPKRRVIRIWIWPQKGKGFFSYEVIFIPCYHFFGIINIAIYLQVFLRGHSSQGSPQPAPMVQQHTDFLISRPLGLVQPSSSNLSKQKPTRTSVEWKLTQNTEFPDWKLVHEKFKRTSGRTNERTDERANARKEQTNEPKNERANKRTDDWTNEWTKEGTNERKANKSRADLSSFPSLGVIKP